MATMSRVYCCVSNVHRFESTDIKICHLKHILLQLPLSQCKLDFFPCIHSGPWDGNFQIEGINTTTTRIYIYIYLHTHIYTHTYIYIYIAIYIYIYSYVCACIHVCVYVYIYIYIYICVCMCVCVCVGTC